MSSVVFRCLVALLSVGTLPLFCDAASAADGKRLATPTAVKPAPEPTGAELVGKLLSEQDGPSNPDVPLPQYGLEQSSQPASTPLGGPQLFGRREDGGGVLGVKIPIRIHSGAN